jgi:hypothetical protein
VARNGSPFLAYIPYFKVKWHKLAVFTFLLFFLDFFLKDSHNCKMLTYKGKKWYQINWSSGWKRCTKIFELYPITDTTDKDLFLIYGYKILSPGDKETYYLLKSLAVLNEKKYKSYSCQVSLFYLSIVLDTTIFCQSRRVKKLKEVGLLSVLKSGGGKSDANTYIPVARALPDSTLISTLVCLIRRKKLLEYIKIFKQEKDTTKNTLVVQNIKQLIKKTPQFEEFLDKELRDLIP